MFKVGPVVEELTMANLTNFLWSACVSITCIQRGRGGCTSRETWYFMAPYGIISTIGVRRARGYRPLLTPPHPHTNTEVRLNVKSSWSNVTLSKWPLIVLLFCPCLSTLKNIGLLRRLDRGRSGAKVTIDYSIAKCSVFHHKIDLRLGNTDIC